MMPQEISDDVVQQALEACAAEPVHIPGAIQPFGWLMAYHRDTHLIQYASDNAAAPMERPIDKLLGHHVKDLFGRELWHALQNFIATTSFGDQRVIVGSWTASEEGETYIVAAWPSDDFIVLEFEAQPISPPLSPQQAQEQSLLIAQVQNAPNVESLLDVATRQLRHLTGFDRVMVYQFDEDWNGAVIAEALSSRADPFIGLNFPSFDIPAQARAIMARVPLRIIADIDQNDVPISAATSDLPPLDISFGETRASSRVHLEYLRNMGSRATMTLSVVVEGKLWGMISFHHFEPRILPTQVRMILTSFLGVFCLKLGIFLGQKFNLLSGEIDLLHREVQGLINTDPNPSELLSVLGSKLSESFQACGFYIQSEKKNYTYGKVPDQKVIQSFLDIVPQNDGDPYFTNHLTSVLPNQRDALAPIAGLASIKHHNSWVLLIFRLETTESIAWAGDPEKTISFAEGKARLSPRGSFSTFLAESQGKSKPWTGEDRVLVAKLWPLLCTALNTEQTQRYLQDLSRQQQLMIDELNHRVRNILALVQAVSTEAKKSQSSLESYSKAIEARIRALAAAHSIGSGTSAKHVDIFEIIRQEAKPYETDESPRVVISGIRKSIQAELAPIFALTIHELMTNAAKYGALSNSTGIVAVVMKADADGLEINWTEIGGPPVQTPVRRGFGTTLIKRAVPYEIGGKSAHIFEAEGVKARIELPQHILTDTIQSASQDHAQPRFADETNRASEIYSKGYAGLALVLEDNFMIAEGVSQQLQDLGFTAVDSASNVESALRIIEAQTPVFAVLDINLGKGQTSFPIAEILLDRNVPIIFATGYGELSSVPPRLAKTITLTKPIDTLELANAIKRAMV